MIQPFYNDYGMKHCYPFLTAFLLLIGLPATGSASSITWKLYLKFNNQPIASQVTREGEPFAVPRVSLSGANAHAQGILDALENATFLVQRTPDNRPLEIRITLNTDGAGFERSNGKPVFLNLTALVYVDGRVEDPFRFPTGAPLEFFLPVTGFTALLARCGFSRGDDIVLAYATGSGFTREDILTANLTSGLQAKISHLSTIVGSRCDILNLKPSPSLNKWHQIKLLFR